MPAGRTAQDVFRVGVDQKVVFQCPPSNQHPTEHSPARDQAELDHLLDGAESHHGRDDIASLEFPGAGPDPGHPGELRNDRHPLGEVTPRNHLEPDSPISEELEIFNVKRARPSAGIELRSYRPNAPLRKGNEFAPAYDDLLRRRHGSNSSFHYPRVTQPGQGPVHSTKLLTPRLP